MLLSISTEKTQSRTESKIKMSKNKRTEIRLSESELENIAQNSAIANLNKSDYIEKCYLILTLPPLTKGEWQIQL